jgi:4-hydroxybenzoate polyprenyltransferase/phosphoserine phosphatase
MNNEVLEISTPIELPLIVDLDGTLVYTDTLWEAILVYLRRNPLRIFHLLYWLRLGKAYFKQRISERAQLDVTSLPYNHELLTMLREQAKLGRRILLATGANYAIANPIAEHLGIFEAVICSDGRKNLVGRAKASAIGRALGEQAFLYAGNSGADLPIWNNSAGAIVVCAPAYCLTRLRRAETQIVRVYPQVRPSLKTYLKAIRVHQWLKNLLIFVPMGLGHLFGSWPLLRGALIGFFAFSMVASSAYIWNDLLDLEADRKHATKRKRPFASGSIPITNGLFLASGLLLAAALLSILLPAEAALLLGGYLVATLIYSAYLKTKLAVDVVTLALFYTLRMLYGGAITGITLSIWTLAFSMFIFLSLAQIKRVIELPVETSGDQARLPRRGYFPTDRGQIAAQAAASGYLAVLVMVLYINSPQVQLLYRHPQVLWATCPLFIYWLNRLLILANRGYLDSDPLVFAIGDRSSQMVALLLGAAVFLAT